MELARGVLSQGNETVDLQAIITSEQVLKRILPLREDMFHKKGSLEAMMCSINKKSARHEAFIKKILASLYIRLSF